MIFDDVPAEDLQPGDIVELSHNYGSDIIRLTSVQHRTGGIKLTGRTENQAGWSWGMEYGRLARRARP
ncbi:hypothetical protein ACGFX4_24140 [Kitasatospora sp. NPDC048365]|uniref:hypothetical protein n=1 Tax=Kitasatospora sp. NPDC048365 TaxID=3364050 RepID=UPI003712D9D7